MQQLGISAIHPTAVGGFTVTLLFSAPIDLDAACARIPNKWPGDWSTPVWDEGTDGAGKVLYFTLGKVGVLLTPMNENIEPPAGQLPPHEFYVVASFFHTADAITEAAADLTGKDNAAELAARHLMVNSHLVYTQVADVLLEEPAAIGVYREELGVVQPPQMFHELAPLLTRGEVPLPLWVNVRTLESGFGRTLGLPIFGHLDLETSAANAAAAYELLANAANYIVSGDAYLLPGQTLSLGAGDPVTLSQEISTVDGATIIKLAN